MSCDGKVEETKLSLVSHDDKFITLAILNKNEFNYLNHYDMNILKYDIIEFYNILKLKLEDYNVDKIHIHSYLYTKLLKCNAFFNELIKITKIVIFD